MIGSSATEASHAKCVRSSIGKASTWLPTARDFAIVAIFLSVLTVSTLPVNAQHSILGAASVIDGDTIEIHGQRVRLYGIDAPESRQECSLADRAPWRCGQQAAFALADRIGRATLRCEPRDRDRYGRIVAVCFNGREDVGRWMVANGWAVAFRRYSLDYVADEDRARRNRLGLWSGTFEMPWDWRARGAAH